MCLKKKDRILFSIYPVFSIAVTFSLVINFGDRHSKSMNYTLMPISTGLLVLNFLLPVIMRRLMMMETQKGFTRY